MGEKSSMAWTNATWNPVTGCTKVSPGCAHCYIERSPPFRMAGRKFERVGNTMTTGVTLHPDRLDKPLHWRKPRRIFVNSLSDLFHDDVPDEFIGRIWDIMARTPQHTYQILTKRPERMRRIITESHKLTAHGEIMASIYGDVGWPLRNVWLGVSVENQPAADERIPLLLYTPAAVRWVSAEPLLGPLNLSEWLRHPLNIKELNPLLSWVVVGGESGPRHRSLDLDWVRTIHWHCELAGVAYFGKQTSGYKSGIALPGELGDREYPA